MSGVQSGSPPGDLHEGMGPIGLRTRGGEREGIGALPYEWLQLPWSSQALGGLRSAIDVESVTALKREPQGSQLNRAVCWNSSMAESRRLTGHSAFLYCHPEGAPAFALLQEACVASAAGWEDARMGDRPGEGLPCWRSGSCLVVFVRACVRAWWRAPI